MQHNFPFKSNYRPNPVLSEKCKTLEESVHKRLTDYLENENLLFDHQYGFSKAQSTCTVLSYLSVEPHKAKE